MKEGRYAFMLLALLLIGITYWLAGDWIYEPLIQAAKDELNKSEGAKMEAEQDRDRYQTLYNQDENTVGPLRKIADEKFAASPAILSIISSTAATWQLRRSTRRRKSESICGSPAPAFSAFIKRDSGIPSPARSPIPLSRNLAMTPTPSQAAAPAIQTRQQLDAVLENIAHLQHERDELYLTQENEIAAVRQRYRAPLTEMEHYLDLETSWAESWARAHPEAFSAERSLACAHATIGFRATPPRIERASRRWTWSRIAVTLAGLAWGKRYLRIPSPEVDKDALLADLADLSPVELRNAGIKVAQGESFFITPHRPAEPAWQEAA